MTPFNQYLASLAPEGETMLFVEQVVKADGKTFWMPYYPTEVKSGALYCNTASFITDRFSNPRKPKAQADNADLVAVLVLDDIGTKSKAPPLEPTWKMETSEGNQQWGYTFALDAQPTKNEFSAAVKAIAEAGFTDKGMVNPVRNFRIDGSVNLKEGKNNFVSRVVEFHPDREFTLADICAALDVVPAEADTAVAGGIKITDDGADIVLRWLSEHDQIIEPTNAEGWTGVICPNYEQHTTGIEGGRYNSITRAFSCFHGHCAHITSETYAQFVENNGGPHYDRGYRSDLVFGRLSDNLVKAGLKPTEAYPDRTEAIIAEVERKEMGRTTKQGWFSRFAYVAPEDSYFDLEERQLVTRRAFDAMFRHIECRSIHGGEKKPRVTASHCYDENRQAMGARTLDGMTYSPGDTVLVSEEGRVYGNRWVDGRRAGSDADADVWLRHVERMVPDDTLRAHVLDAMAYKMQNPKRKINHAILHYGCEGAGKDAMWSPFFHGIGMRNVTVNDVDQISGDWGYSLENEVIVFNELKEASASERRALANRLKGLIAAPPDKLEVRRKGEHPYMIPNRAFVMAFTNHPAAISLASADRRWLCVHSTAPRMEEADARRLWGWYERGGYDAVAGYLRRRDVSAFNPSAIPMDTDFKRNMIEMGRGDAETYLIDLMRNCQGEFAKGVVAGPWNKLTDLLQGGLPNGKVYKMVLMESFKEAGWIDRGLIMSKQHTTKRHVFCHPDLADLSNTELRRIVEEPVELKVVK